MQYGIRITEVEALPSDPRDVCGGQWAQRLPEGEAVALYFGSEFCEEALPDVAKVEALCAFAQDRQLEAVLLTPIVTDRGLARIRRLLDALEDRSRLAAVVFNDWGVLGLLQDRFPGLARRGGRLLNRSLRDPRENSSFELGQPGGVRPPRADRLRRFLRAAGAVAVETDPDCLGGYLGEGDDGLERTLHLPYSFATSGRNCLVRAAASDDAGFVHSLGHSCNRPCAAGPRRMARADTGVPLWRAGNTVFQEAPEAWVRTHLRKADRIVLHARPAP